MVHWHACMFRTVMNIFINIVDDVVDDAHYDSEGKIEIKD